MCATPGRGGYEQVDQESESEQEPARAQRGAIHAAEHDVQPDHRLDGDARLRLWQGWQHLGLRLR
eukprot:1203217-Pyramimonas_sp.AAC.1